MTTTITLDQPIQQQIISFDEFLAKYSGSDRHELINKEAFDLEPTGWHEEVAALITTLNF